MFASSASVRWDIPQSLARGAGFVVKHPASRSHESAVRGPALRTYAHDAPVRPYDPASRPYDLGCRIHDSHIACLGLPEPGAGPVDPRRRMFRSYPNGNPSRAHDRSFVRPRSRHRARGTGRSRASVERSQTSWAGSYPRDRTILGRNSARPALASSDRSRTVERSARRCRRRDRGVLHRSSYWC